MSLILLGLGRNKNDLTLAAVDALKNADKVFLRTENTPSSDYLREENIAYESFDGLYESCRSFDRMTKAIVTSVKKAMKSFSSVVYAVDGAVSEDLSCAALVKSVKDVKVIEGVSKISYALSACGVSGKGYTALSAYDLESFENFTYPLVVFDLDSKLLASAWKLRIFDLIGEEVPVKLLIGGLLKKIEAYEIDNFEGYDYSTVLVIEGKELIKKERFVLSDLYDILYILRSENGCPWDKVQTKESIRENLIEEAYELVDAINCNDDEKIREEIGDVLMQAAFHTVFAEERGAFTRNDVVTELCRKLITRHTHVFGEDKVKDDQSALALWNKNKQKEKGMSNAFDYVSAVPQNFPGCLRAEKTFKRSMVSGFKTADTSPDSIKELVENLASAEDKTIAAGKLLYSTVAAVKQAGVSAEQALADYIDGYLKRLEFVEKALKESGKDITELEDKDFDKIYDELKKA